MPTENEIRVLRLLSAIEISPNAGATIEGWGNEAVTVLCEAALGSYPGLRQKVRTNAVSVLGSMSHPQTAESLRMLVKDSSPDVAIRAMRAAGVQKNEGVIPDLKLNLNDPATQPLLAAEAVKGLVAINTTEAQEALSQYLASSASSLPHRGSEVVGAVVKRLALH